MSSIDRSQGNDCHKFKERRFIEDAVSSRMEEMPHRLALGPARCRCLVYCTRNEVQSTWAVPQAIDLFFFLGRPLTTIQHPVSTSGDHSTFLNPMSSSVPLQNVYYERVCPSPLSLLDPLKLTRGRRRKSRPPNHATSVVDRLGPCSRRSRPMTSCIPVMPISPTRQPFPIHQLPLPMCLCDSSGL